MAGLIKEAQELLSQKEEADPSVLDAALITAAQKVELMRSPATVVFGPSPAFSESRMSKSCYKILSTKKNLRTKSSPLAAEEAINLDAAETDVEIVQEAEKTK